MQEPKTPYCGAITYLALTGKPSKLMKQVHEKGRLKPSYGFFYLSFHKLDNNAKSFVENKGIMIKKTDTKCFDSMWAFEKTMQKITKKEFIRKVLENNKKIFDKNSEKISIYKKLTHKDYKKIISSSLDNNNPVGVMISHKSDYSTMLVPHWITIHGYNKNNYLVFNSLEGRKSEWIGQEQIFNSMDLNRKISFSPMIVYLIQPND